MHIRTQLSRRPGTWLCLAALGLAASSFGVPSPQLRAHSGEVSAERLSRVTRTLQERVHRNEIPGAVVLVARDGHVLLHNAVGQRDLESGAAMSTDTLFRISSMTKPVVSAALLILYEEGRFVLSDPVSKWLPEFRDMRVVSVPLHEQRAGLPYRSRPARTPITIWHVLTHTAGLPNGSGITAEEYRPLRPGSGPDDTLAGVTQRLAGLPLHFEPGTGWQYGPATDVVARLIEVISGQRLDVFLQERLFGPLNMTDTHFSVPAEKRTRLASVYRTGKDAALEREEAGDASSPFAQPNLTYLSGTSGLVSTARDYFRFQQLILNGGALDGVQVLGRKTVEMMLRDHVGALYPEHPRAGFGLGYEVASGHYTGAAASPGTFGWPGGRSTVSFVDPAERIVAVLMMQLRPAAGIRREYEAFQALTYQLLTGPRAAGFPRAIH